VGSIEFAASEFGTRLVVVMGHTHCGAVRATLRALGRGGGPASRNQRSIVDRIAPHVEHLIAEAGDSGSGALDESRMAEAVRANVLASARELPRSSSLIRELVDKGRVAIAAAVYDLATGVVSFVS
jgi:carbonic anhydrase